VGYWWTIENMDILFQIFLFFIQFWCNFSINWLPRELPVVCWRISSISYGFRDKLNRKGPHKWNSKIGTFLFFIQFSCKIIIFMGYGWTIIKWYLVSKRGKYSDISHIWKICRICSFLYNFDAFFLWIDCVESSR
jgi:hypothetical protein